MGVVLPEALRWSRERALVWVFGDEVNGHSTWWAVAIAYEQYIERLERTGV